MVRRSWGSRWYTRSAYRLRTEGDDGREGHMLYYEVDANKNALHWGRRNGRGKRREHDGQERQRGSAEKQRDSRTYPHHIPACLRMLGLWTVVGAGCMRNWAERKSGSHLPISVPVSVNAQYYSKLNVDYSDEVSGCLRQAFLPVCPSLIVQTCRL